NTYKDHANWADAKLLTTAGPELPVVSITATDPDAAETETGETADPGEIVISRTGGDLTSPLTVRILDVGGSATRNVDYTIPIIGFDVIIPANETSVILPVDVIDDDDAEPLETVSVQLGFNGNYTYDGANDTATVTITDNELIFMAVDLSELDPTSAISPYGGHGTNE